MKHGTYTAYARKGCRCDACRTYQNERVARNRADRLNSGRLSHGKRSAYDAGCRCVDCRKTRIEKDTEDRRHNHDTPDVQKYGECAVCDDIWAGVLR